MDDRSEAEVKIIGKETIAKKHASVLSGKILKGSIN